MSKLAIRTTVDEIHGESDGTPFHWRVWWVRVTEDGQEIRLRPIAMGRSADRVKANIARNYWTEIAKVYGPANEWPKPHLKTVSEGLYQWPILTQKTLPISKSVYCN